MSETSQSSDVTFASRVFRIAAIYGVVVLLPLYLLPVPHPWRLTHFGFVGVTLVFQAVFWIIARDPLHYRALMPLAICEKLIFGIPALAFFVQGQADPVQAVFGALDMFWATMFFLAMRRLRASS